MAGHRSLMNDVQEIGSEILHRLEKYAQEYGYKKYGSRREK
jgi:hypothetical protein